jgi:hypothetical protein
MAIAAYWSIINSTFIADDYFFLQKASHASLLQSWQMPDVWLSSVFRPLGTFVWWLQFHIFDVSTFPAHLINVSLHAGSAYLLFLLMKKTSFSQIASMMAGMLLLLSPLAPEEVTFTGGRFGVMTMFFSLLSINLYTSYLKKQGGYYYAGFLITLIAALLSKENAIILIILIPALDFLIWPVINSNDAENSPSGREYTYAVALVRLLPVFLVFLIYFLVRLFLLRGIGGYAPLIADTYSLKGSIRTFWVLLDPLNINLIFNKSIYFFLGFFSLSLFLMSAFLMLLRFGHVKPIIRRMTIFFLLFFLSSLVPVQWYVFSKGVSTQLVGSHFLYFSLAGAFPLITAGLYEYGWKKNCWPKIITILLIPMLVFYFIGLNINNRAWQETSEAYQRLSEDTVSTLPTPHPNSTILFKLENDITETSFMIDGSISALMEITYRRDDLIATYIEPGSEFQTADYFIHYDVKNRKLIDFKETDVRLEKP